MTKVKYKCPLKIEVKRSPGKDRGVFATKVIRSGEVIEAGPALIVPKKDRKRLEDSFLKHYMFQTDDGQHYVVGMGYVAIANHSDEPNAAFDVTSDLVIIRALKHISAGKEITVDYGWDESDWEEIGGRAKKRSVR